MSKVAVVTGANSGIGEAIAHKLLVLGYEVHGIARFSTKAFEDKNFIPHEIDLSKAFEPPPLERVDLLVNSAGVGYFGKHEKLNANKIREMVEVNLTAPLLITNFYLDKLKEQKGCIININSISGISPAPFGAVYGATKSALRHFGLSLFKEQRKSGLKVVNINPDITKTPFFDTLSFQPTDDPLNYIEPKDIAQIVADILEMREGSVVTDITVEPQIFSLKRDR